MLTVWVPVLLPTSVGGDRIGMLRAGLDSPGALTRLHAAPLVVNDRVSPALLDSPSAATNTKGSSVEPLSWRVSPDSVTRSEEHTSELQSRENIVWRLMLEKKK